MKNAFHIFLITLTIAGLLLGCSSKNITSVDNSKPSVLVEPLEQALKLPDDKLVDKFCAGVDLCLGDSLLFDNGKDISSETLFTFFCYITSSQEYGQDYQNKWENKDNNNYRVPVADIKEILNRYFDGINFDSTQINGYQAQTEEIVIGGLGGFGGGRFPELIKKEQLNNDTLKLTVDYYDDQYKTVFYTKAYTIRFTANGYQYLAIKKVFAKE